MIFLTMFVTSFALAKRPTRSSGTLSLNHNSALSLPPGKIPGVRPSHDDFDVLVSRLMSLLNSFLPGSLLLAAASSCN